MDETPEASNAVIAYEIVHHDKELASKQSTTSNEAPLREKGEPDVVIVYSTISRPTPLNYAPPADVKGIKCKI